MTTSYEPPARDPRTIWKEQEMTTRVPSPRQLEARHRRLENRVRLRNRVEYVAGGVVFAGALLLAGWMLAGDTSLHRTVVAIGTLLLGAGALLVCVQLHRRTGGPVATDGSDSTRARYRADLVRQRDALRSVFGWYIAPFLPGLVLIYGAVLLEPGIDRIRALILAVATAAFLAWVLHMNRRAAEGIDTELRVLDEEGCDE